MSFRITFTDEEIKVGAATCCYTPLKDLPDHHWYNSTENKFYNIARKNGTTEQIEFLRSLKKVDSKIYEEVEDYLDGIRMNLPLETIKELMKV